MNINMEWSIYWETLDKHFLASDLFLIPKKRLGTFKWYLQSSFDMTEVFNLFLFDTTFVLFIFKHCVDWCVHGIYSEHICACMYAHTYIFFSMLFSIIVYYRILSVVPCAMQWDLIVYFINNVYTLIPNS